MCVTWRLGSNWASLCLHPVVNVHVQYIFFPVPRLCPSRGAISHMHTAFWVDNPEHKLQLQLLDAELLTLSFSGTAG